MRKNHIIPILAFVVLLDSSVKAQTKTISASLGTQGAGLEFKYAPAADYGLHAGFSILPFKTGFAYTAQSTPSDVDLKVDFQNAHLIFDWHPFVSSKGFSSFLLSGGAGYFWKNTGTAVITTRETYKYGDIIITPESAGQLIGKVSWTRISPYFGIGFENPRPSKRFNLGFAAGVYYLGKPKTTLTGTKLISVDDKNNEQFSRNLDSYRFLPVLQLNLNYSLK